MDSQKDNSFDSEASDEEPNEEEDTKKEPQENYLEQNKPLISAISETLSMILEQNKSLEDYKEIIKQQSKMAFSANSIPEISIEDYLIRIQTYSNIEKSTLIISLIYIDRICENSNLNLTYFNIHRILFTAVLMSIKYNEDNFYDNKFYAEIAGVKLKELNMIENNFSDMIDFKYFVDDETYEKYKNYLEGFEKNN